MKKLILMSLRNLFSKKGSFIILTIQLTIALVVIVYFAAGVGKFFELRHIVRSSGIENYVYFCPHFLQYGNEEILKEVDEMLLTLSEIKSSNKIRTIFGKKLTSEDEGFTNCYVGDSAFLERVQLPLSNGTWFDDYSNENNLLPIIISPSLKKEFRLNKIYDLLLSSVYDTRNIKVKVIGILKKPSYVLSFSGNSLEGAIRQEDDVIIFPYNDAIATMQNILSSSEVALLPNEDFSFSDDSLERLNEKVSEYGEVKTFGKMLDEYEENNKDIMYFMLSFGIIIFAIALAGIGGNNVLSLISNEKNYALYFMHGATWKKCISISLIKDSISLILPIILSTGIICLLGKTSDELNIYVQPVQPVHIIISLAFCLLIFIVTSLIPILKFYKTSPISLIRKRL